MPRYCVKVDGTDFDILLEYRSERFEVTVNGEACGVDTHSLGESRFLLLIDNHSYEVDIRPADGDGDKIVFTRGMEIPVQVEDYNLAQLRKLSGSATAASVEHQIKAPMPGLIVGVKVKPGDHVTKGQPLVVIEAMKMENIIKAKADATIKDVRVTAGNSVEKGDTLLELA